MSRVYQVTAESLELAYMIGVPQHLRHYDERSPGNGPKRKYEYTLALAEDLHLRRPVVREPSLTPPTGRA